jgi:UDP-4-amino-4,6-dideoxy-N-acetyl-beta-L-altrosamine N-acetyltransferase
MTESDLEQVLLWRNHSKVRRFMYSTHNITREEHHNWFAGASENHAISLMIFEYNGNACGFVNITLTRCREVADWGFYLSPDARRGTGMLLGREALGYAFNELGLHKICGQALGFNERSIAFHKALGFTEEGRLRDQHFDGAFYHDALCYGLLDSEWQSQIKEKSNE